MSETKCRHEWGGPEFRCKHCDALRYLSAPAWVMCKVLGKGGRGPRAVWIALWNCADRNTSKPDPVYPGNERLKQFTGGLGDRMIQKHLEWLEMTGWIRRVSGESRRQFELAWASPNADWAQAWGEQNDAQSEEKFARRKAKEPAGGANNPAGDAKKSAGQSEEKCTHTFDHLGETLELTVDHGDAVADTPDGIDLRESTTPTDTTPIAPPTPEARPPQVNDDPTSTECDDGATGSTLDMFGNATTPAKTGRVTKRSQVAVDVDDLRTLHEETRRLAYEHHGIQWRPLPAAGTKSRKDLDSAIAAMVADHGADRCREILAWRGVQWRRDRQQLVTYGKRHAWASKSVDYAITHMDAEAAGVSPRTNGQQRRGPNVSGYDLHKEFPCDGT